MKFVFLATIYAVLCFAQHAETVQAGQKIFVSNCSACHGDTAKGGRGPDLTTGDWKHGGAEADLVRNIIKGIPGTQMPAIALSEATGS